MMRALILLLALLVGCGGGETFSERRAPAMAALMETDATRIDPNDLDSLLNFRIRVYIDRIFSTNLTPPERAAWIQRAADENGVSHEMIARATGYSLEDVRAYLAQGNPAAPPPMAEADIERLAVKVNPIRLLDPKTMQVEATGSWLSELTAVYLNGRRLKLTHQGYTSLGFELDKVTCGQLEADVLFSHERIIIGSVAVTGKCTGSVNSISLKQNFVAWPTLVQGKSLGVIADVTSPVFPANILVRVYQDGEQVYEAPMVAPSFRELKTYIARVPGEHVKPGMQVKVVGNDSWIGGAEYSASASAPVGPKLTAKLVLVPLITSDGLEPVMYDIEGYREHVIRKLPLPDDIDISIAPAARLPVPMTTSDDWGDALTMMLSIRNKSWQVNALYYGLVRFRGTSIAGIAYINGSVGLGIDTSLERVMTHEIGHNLGLYHAPCGNVVDYDSEFPYLNGGIGPVAPFDLAGFDKVSTSSDIMGYCGGTWFSDYNYRKLEANVLRRFGTARDEVAEVGSLLRLRGTQLESLGTHYKPEGVAASMVVNGEPMTGVLLQADHLDHTLVWVPRQRVESLSLSRGGAVGR